MFGIGRQIGGKFRWQQRQFVEGIVGKLVKRVSLTDSKLPSSTLVRPERQKTPASAIRTNNSIAASAHLAEAASLPDHIREGSLSSFSSTSAPCAGNVIDRFRSIRLFARFCISRKGQEGYPA